MSWHKLVEVSIFILIVKINNTDLENVEVISDENIKKQILNNSIFAVSKSGTISLTNSSMVDKPKSESIFLCSDSEGPI